MKSIIASVCLAGAALAASADVTVTVSNPLPVMRAGEMVEVDASRLCAKGQKSCCALREGVTVYDAVGNEIPSQVTSDRKVIFQATVPAKGKAVYRIAKGQPKKAVTPRCYGRVFPEHKDNMNWENDRAAYVAPGPALQRKGQQVYGYDIWTKSVDTLVVEQRNRDNMRKISMHKDHGTGMDAYMVAGTLGAGTAALLAEDGKPIYPWAWAESEVVDNGPLRFRTILKMSPITVDGDTAVIETRDITLDAGSDLNRTLVNFSRLPRRMPIAAGIVVHEQHPDGYAADDAKGVIVYADSTDNAHNNNGVIYIGCVIPGKNKGKSYYRPIDNEAKDALGHIMLPATIADGETLEYWWGSEWSKSPWGPESEADWLDRMRFCSDRIAKPLKVKVKGRL